MVSQSLCCPMLKTNSALFYSVHVGRSVNIVSSILGALKHTLWPISCKTFVYALIFVLTVATCHPKPTWIFNSKELLESQIQFYADRNFVQLFLYNSFCTIQSTMYDCEFNHACCSIYMYSLDFILL